MSIKLFGNSRAPRLQKNEKKKAKVKTKRTALDRVISLFLALVTLESLYCTAVFSNIPVIAEPWQSERYYERVKGLEDEPEGGRRCTECFRLRLEETARVAAENCFDYFCTTLTLSRHKDAVRINSLAEEIARTAGVRWLPSDFKKRDGENRSIELCERYHVYRQLYCGCEYSLKKRVESRE